MKTTLKQYWRAFDVVTKKWNELFYTAQLLFNSRAAVVHLNIQARSTFPVPVFTVPSSMERTSSRCNKVDAVKLYTSFRLNLHLLKGQICVNFIIPIVGWHERFTTEPFKPLSDHRRRRNPFFPAKSVETTPGNWTTFTLYTYWDKLFLENPEHFNLVFKTYFFFLILC